MPSEWVINSANILQSLIPLLSLIAYIPQWKKLSRTKSSRDISLEAWLLWSVSGAIAVYYALVQHWISGQGLALVFSSISIFIFVLVTILLVYWYRDPRQPGVDK